MNVINTLVGESHDIALAGYRTILGNSRTIAVVGVASNSKDLLKQAKKLRPHVCLISSTLRTLNLEKLFPALKALSTPPGILFISAFQKPVNLDSALKAGADGYLLSDIPKAQLRAAIDRVARGEKVFDKTTSRHIHNRYIERLQKRSANESGVALTRRETEILNFLVEGYTSREIATRLYISPRTVDTHRSNMLQKLNIKNTPALIRYILKEDHPS